ncbi:secretory phospholipase A2 receptor-like [Cydia amplana]|uniref:secretory phospholipase A2 receptor-like n=1 Tax=Cydia amplana TaxID=1869771 RepID=UPI002FE6A8E7
MRYLLGVMLLASSVLCDRIDYVENSKLGRSYKLMYSAATWQDAKQTCLNNSGKLAVPKSQDEFNVIQGLIRKMHYPSIIGWTGSRLLAWVGISSVEEPAWRNVDGEDIENTGFSTWAKGNGEKSSNPKEPHCAVMDAANPGLRSYWCHHKQPFVCEFHLNP